MATVSKTPITIETSINVPVEKVWEFWTAPEHITQWTYASEDWHAPYADNDLRKEGKFKTTMAAKDNSFSFDFEGIYTNVKNYHLLEYVLADSRTVKIQFISIDKGTKVIETFDPEEVNPVEMQRGGWQAILDNFKKYAEVQLGQQ